jgi:hypothetical protein
MRARRWVISSVIVLSAPLLNGCMLIGAAAAGAFISSVADEDRERFHRMNLEREKAGLKPLTEEEWLQKEAAEQPKATT